MARENSGDRKLWESLLIPIALTIVGTVGTYFVTEQQIESAYVQSQTELESTERLARSGQQIRLLEIFFDKITADDSRERETAILILKTLEPELGTRLAEAIVRSQPEPTEVRMAAQAIVDVSPENFLRRHYEHIRKKELEEAWNSLSDHFKELYLTGDDEAERFRAYKDWWSSVEDARLNHVTILRQTESEAFAKIDFTYKTSAGKAVEDQAPYVKLVFNRAENRWQFYEKRDVPFPVIDRAGVQQRILAR